MSMALKRISVSTRRHIGDCVPAVVRQRLTANNCHNHDGGPVSDSSPTVCSVPDPVLDYDPKRALESVRFRAQCSIKEDIFMLQKLQDAPAGIALRHSQFGGSPGFRPRCVLSARALQATIV
ncbi:hypothetical protein EVAR_6015_1 [Eumeta japonica]|uniref:Uncharacterized protein n=1 Tax=Eumeta variegata TaxID=151549 RepID=A0A4C1TC78_EUMVA|nr:hypothetical protein EVAR_6015_1 [Eumeta japonica]